MKMRRLHAGMTLALVAGALLAGCGGTTHATQTVYTSPAAPKYIPTAGRHYQGRGSKKLGTIVVQKRSVLHWASDGVVFQLWDAGDKPQQIQVRTQEHVGRLTLKPGTYKRVSVIAFGNWLVTISPG
jgi:hypothetical protein